MSASDLNRLQDGLDQSHRIADLVEQSTARRKEIFESMDRIHALMVYMDRLQELSLKVTVATSIEEIDSLTAEAARLRKEVMGS